MDSLWGNLFKGEDREKEQTFDVLRGIPVFRDLTPRELACIERILHKRHYDAGEIIFSQGAMGAGMYIIVNGTVRIVSEPDGKTIAELGDGEFFGEIALLDESPRSASAVAVTPSAVLGFFQGDLFGLTERNPKLGIKVLLKLSRMIGRRLLNANAQTQRLEESLSALRDSSKDGGS